MLQEDKLKRNISRNHKISIIQLFGGGFLIYASINSIVHLRETLPMGGIFFYLILTVLFLYMFICGIIRIILGRRYPLYIKQLRQKPSYSIEQLAAELNVTNKVVRSNLEWLIKKKLLEDIYLDDVTNSIVNKRLYSGHPDYVNSEPEIEECDTEETEIEETDNEESVATPVRMIQIVCKNCGAPNKVHSNSAAECMYCGSIIN